MKNKTFLVAQCKSGTTTEFRYATEVLKDRFELGEELILASKKYAYQYKIDILGRK